MPSYPHLRCLFAAVGIASAPAVARSQVTVPVPVLPRYIELEEPRSDKFYLASETPIAYPAEVRVERSPLPTAIRAMWLGPGLRAQVGVERLTSARGAADGFGALLGLSYPLKRMTTSFFGADLHGELSYGRSDRPDRSYRTQVDGTLGLAKVGLFPLPRAIDAGFSIGPIVRYRSAPAPRDRSTGFVGGGLTATLFATLKQKCLGAHVTGEWSRIGDPYRGPGHHGDFKLALGLHYEYDLITDPD